MKEKPELSFETIKRMEDLTWFTHAQIFDDLLIVAQRETACFVWKTSAGLVIFDGIWPDRTVYDEIIKAIEEAGWDAGSICKYVMTHGHVDHTGCGKWITENHTVKTYLSEVDDVFWREHPTKPERPETWKDFEISCYVKDGDIIDCGSGKIQVIGTPGHTPGCLSYLFPVHDAGKEHMAALFGGATPPWNNSEGVKQQKESISYFMKRAEENAVDVALSNHTAFDNGLERICYSQARYTYMPNIYVLGEDGFQKFCQIYNRLLP